MSFNSPHRLKVTDTACASSSDVNIACNFRGDYDIVTGYSQHQRLERLRSMEHVISRVSEENLVDRQYANSVPSVKANIGCLTFNITVNSQNTEYASKFVEAKSAYPGYEDTFFLVEHILNTDGLMSTETGAGEITRFQLMAVLLWFFEVSSCIH